MSENDFSPPKPTAGDTAHAVARAGLGSIPIVGAAASELLTLLVAPPLERRRNAWMARVGEALRGLEASKGIDLEQLRDNDTFIDIVSHASQAALRTSHEKKQEALKNAIVSAALPGSPDSALQLVFVRLVDSFTEWHLRMLELFQAPDQWFSVAGRPFPGVTGGLADVLEAAYPELGGRRDFYDLVWRELFSAGLTTTDSLHGMMTNTGMRSGRTTELGGAFLAYVNAPA